MCKIMPMKTITVPIGVGRTDLCKLIGKVEAGARVILTSHGHPKAVISAYRAGGSSWRAETPDYPVAWPGALDVGQEADFQAAGFVQRFAGSLRGNEFIGF